jgi:hypothetical protein
MCRSILRECRCRRRGRLIWEPRWRGSVRTRRGIAPVVQLPGWLSREHRTGHEPWRGSRIGRYEVGVEPIRRRGSPELASGWWRTMLSRSITRIEPGIHAVGRHLPDGGPLSGRRLDGCWWWSPAAFVQFMRGFVYRQPSSNERMKNEVSQCQVQAEG